MPAPVKIVMDDLYAIRDVLLAEDRYAELSNIDALIESANTGGHYVYSFEGIREYVQRTFFSINESNDPIATDVQELIKGANWWA